MNAPRPAVWPALALLAALPLLLLCRPDRPAPPSATSAHTVPAGDIRPLTAPEPPIARSHGAMREPGAAPEALPLPASPGPVEAPADAQTDVQADVLAPLPAAPLHETLRWPTNPETDAEVRALLDLVALAVSEQRFADMDALIAAVKARGPAAIVPLLDVLREDDGTRLPIYAAVILGEMEAERPDPALARLVRERALPLLEDLAMAREDASLRHAALVALGKIGDPGSFDLLVDALAHEGQGPVGEQAARSLAALRGAEATAALARLAAAEPEPALRRSLVEALAARGDPEALPALEGLARSDYSGEVRLEAVRGLAALEGAEADRLLREIARSPEAPELRAAALGGLGVAGDERDLDLLEDALQFSTSNEVRTAAYGGLARIGTENARRVTERYRRAARLERVFPGTNAEASGLRPDDLVLDYGGEAVEDARGFKALIERSRPNQVIPVRVIRDGREITLAVTGGFLGVAARDGVARN